MVLTHISISPHWRESTSACFRSGVLWNIRNTLKTSACGLRGSGQHRTLRANQQVGVDSLSVPPFAQRGKEFIPRPRSGLAARPAWNFVREARSEKYGQKDLS